MNEIEKYVGYRAEDFDAPHAKFFDENMANLPAHVLEALEKSPFESGKLPPFDEAVNPANKGYEDIETGFCVQKNGEIRVAILTEMPRVSPEMWDWWFGWHGSRDNRYKLWHPKAHLAARWADGKDDENYIGRTSVIVEYIGKSLEHASISFVAPTEIGINLPNDDVFICARVGYSKYPLDFGWLLHQVRATEKGAEMRSRFWFGGEHIKVRGNGAISNAASKLLQKVVPAQQQRAKDLLIHCAEEMNHLARFLPKIYKEFVGG